MSIHIGKEKTIMHFMSKKEPKTTRMEGIIWDCVPSDSGIVIVSIDVDLNPELAKMYNVTRLPTFFLLEDNQELYRHKGLIMPAGLKKLIQTKFVKV